MNLASILGSSAGSALGAGATGYVAGQQQAENHADNRLALATQTAGQQQSQKQSATKFRDDRLAFAQKLQTQDINNRTMTAQADIAEQKAQSIVNFMSQQNDQDKSKNIMAETFRQMGSIYTDSASNTENSARLIQKYNSATSMTPTLIQANPSLAKLDPTSPQHVNYINGFLKNAVGVSDEVIDELGQDFYIQFANTGGFAGQVNKDNGMVEGVLDMNTLIGSMDSIDAIGYDAKLELSQTMQAINGSLIAATEKVNGNRKPTVIEERAAMVATQLAYSKIPENLWTKEMKSDNDRISKELTKAYETAYSRDSVNKGNQIKKNISNANLPTKPVVSETMPDNSSAADPLSRYNMYRDAFDWTTGMPYQDDEGELHKVKSADTKNNTLTLDSGEVVQLGNYADSLVEAEAKDRPSDASIESTFKTSPDYKTGKWSDREVVFAQKRKLADQVKSTYDKYADLIGTGQLNDNMVSKAWQFLATKTNPSESNLQRAGITGEMGQLVQAFTKIMSGAAASDFDTQFTEKNMFGSPNDTGETRLRVFKSFLDSLQSEVDSEYTELGSKMPSSYPTKQAKQPAKKAENVDIKSHGYEAGGTDGLNSILNNLGN